MKCFKKTRDWYQDLSKEKKRQDGPEQYNDLPEDKKQRLIEQRKKYCKELENKTVSQIKGG